MYLIFFIGLIVVFLMNWTLRGRVRVLEEKVFKNLNQGVQNTPTQASVSPSVPNATNVAPVQVEQKQAAPVQEKPNAFIEWLKEDWLLKFGVLILILAFVWFLAYAFAENIIDENGRVTLGIIAGIASMLVAEWRVRSHPRQGGAFYILGSGILFLSLFSAHVLSNIIKEPVVCLGLMFLVSLYVALVSLRFNMKALAIISLLMSFFAPILSNIDFQSNDLLIPVYLLLVVLSSVWVTAFRGWRVVTLVALCGVILYSLAYADSRTLMDSFLPFVYIFSAIFFTTNVFGFFKEKGNGISNMLVAFLNTLFILGWTVGAVQKEWVSLVLVLIAVVFAISSYAIFHYTKNKLPFFAYALSALTLIAVATAVELNGPELLVAYMFEIAVLSIGSYLVTKNLKIGEGVALLILLPGFVVVVEYLFSYEWERGINHEGFYISLLFGVITLLLFAFYHMVSKGETQNKADRMYGVLGVIGSYFLFALLWQVLHAGKADQDIATMLSLLVYTIIGLATNIVGKLKGNNILRYYGGVLVGFVILRLLVLDIWAMDISGRIITFFLIGGLLISTAFIGRKKQIQ